ncbi:hypothetical protein ACFOOP_07610 [Marinicaulis aureus]|uniref:Uncharacterized protein n=1 Tax=Hyphococcus aureus TaxID=2666033 RepID=A0ABW1KUW3_9PROT
MNRMRMIAPDAGESAPQVRLAESSKWRQIGLQPSNGAGRTERGGPEAACFTQAACPLVPLPERP